MGLKIETQALAVKRLPFDFEVNICPRDVFAVTPEIRARLET